MDTTGRPNWAIFVLRRTTFLACHREKKYLSHLALHNKVGYIMF